MKGLVLAALVVCPLAAAEQTRSFTLAPGPAKLIIDNVWGGIEVSPGAAGRIDVGVTETRSGGAEDAKLLITQEGNTVKFYVDGPFRDGKSNGRRGRDYEARFDFKATVPREIALELSTVMKGDLRVRGTAGEFRLSHVNGRIEATDIAGHGDVTTVNGELQASFARVPDGPVRFKTINGDLTAAFPEGLNAEVNVKSLNGDAWSAFEYTHLPLQPVASQEGSRYRLRSGGTRLRIGSGGPTLSFETINGPIRIEKRGK